MNDHHLIFQTIGFIFHLKIDSNKGVTVVWKACVLLLITYWADSVTKSEKNGIFYSACSCEQCV